MAHSGLTPEVTANVFNFLSVILTFKLIFNRFVDKS